jgi:hypothetical protein
MATVVTFLDYTPPERADSISWASVEIYESATVDGTYTLIDTLALVAAQPGTARLHHHPRNRRRPLVQSPVPRRERWHQRIHRPRPERQRRP